MTTPYNAQRTVCVIHPGYLTIQVTGYAMWHHIECTAAETLTEDDRSALARAISRDIENAYRHGWENALREVFAEYDQATRNDEEPDFEIDPRILSVDDEQEDCTP